MVEHLPSICKALCLTPGMIKKKSLMKTAVTYLFQVSLGKYKLLKASLKAHKQFNLLICFKNSIIEPYKLF